MEQTSSELKQSIEKLSSLHYDSIQEIKSEAANRLVSATKDLEMQLKHPRFFWLVEIVLTSFHLR